MEPSAGARTVTVAPARLARWLEGFTERHGTTRAVASEHTVALLGSDESRAWITVPFPPLTGSLVEHAARPRRIAVLLVRRGGHAAGIFDGATLVASKVGSSYVQGTTKAGGWSQHRYARRRANQADAAFARAADDAAGVLLGLDRPLDGVITGGDRAAVRAVLEDRRLAPLVPLVTEPWLQVKDPRLRVLTATPEQFLAVTIRLDP